LGIMIAFLLSIFWFIFLLWFTLSVVRKLKRIEILSRAHLQVIAPEHALFTTKKVTTPTTTNNTTNPFSGELVP